MLNSSTRLAPGLSNSTLRDSVLVSQRLYSTTSKKYRQQNKLPTTIDLPNTLREGKVHKNFHKLLHNGQQPNESQVSFTQESNFLFVTSFQRDYFSHKPDTHFLVLVSFLAFLKIFVFLDDKSPKQSLTSRHCCVHVTAGQENGGSKFWLVTSLQLHEHSGKYLPRSPGKTNRGLKLSSSQVIRKLTNMDFAQKI